MKKTLALLVVPAAVAGFAMSAEAAPAHGSGATLVVSSSDGSRVSSTTTAAGSSLVFSGCGYAANTGVRLTVQTPEALSFFGAMTNSQGCFSTASTQDFYAWAAGDYKASSYQSSNKRADATSAFSVAP